LLLTISANSAIGSPLRVLLKFTAPLMSLTPTRRRPRTQLRWWVLPPLGV